MGAHKPLEADRLGWVWGEVDSYFEYNRAMISRNREAVFLGGMCAQRLCYVRLSCPCLACSDVVGYVGGYTRGLSKNNETKSSSAPLTPLWR